MLTEALEPIYEPLARRSGIPVDEYATWSGGELLATLMELVFDATTRGWLNKLLQGTVGAVALFEALTRGVSPRLRRELIAIGNHALGRVLDPKPSELRELADTVRDLASALRARDWRSALYSGVRNPFELRDAALALAAAIRAAASPPPVAPPQSPPPVVTPPQAVAPRPVQYGEVY